MKASHASNGIISLSGNPEEWPKCPDCGSENTRCYHDTTWTYLDPEDNQEFDSPVGYFVCNSCGQSWVEHDIVVNGKIAL